MENKARLLTIDIETYRTRDEVLAGQISMEAMGKEPAQNAAKALKEQWNTAQGRAARAREALEKTAVDVAVAEALCAVTMLDRDDPSHCFDGMRGGERAMLEALREHLDQYAGPQTVWIGHNIEGFDLPVLLNRWRRYGMKPPEHFPVYYRSRWRGWVFDTMSRFPAKTPFTSLDAACAAMGIAGKEYVYKGMPMEGSRVGEAFEAGDYGDVLAYCAADVAIERELYMRLTCGDTWGTYGLEDLVARQIAELEGEDGLTDGARAIAMLNVLKGAGLVPRIAA